MSSPELKARLHTLAQEVLEASQADDSELMPGQPGWALHHPTRDNDIIEQPSFAPAVIALGSLPQFSAVADLLEAKRVVLQFIYDFFERQYTLEFDDHAFEATWSSFWDELAKSEWTYLAICYLENFTSDTDRLDLGHGVTIRERSSYPFREVGWSDSLIARLHEDWFGSSQYLLVAEDKVPKSPDNLIARGTGELLDKPFRMLRALRLAKEGEVHIGGTPMIGRLLTTRPSGSGFSTGGMIHGLGTHRFGGVYSLAPSDTPRVRALYDQLMIVEGMAEQAPYNLSLALRSLESSYDRIPPRNDTRLVDLITAAEALLGAGSEISFRLSFRIAGILAESDLERVRIFDDMRDFYDTRSRVVHGAALRPKHYAHLENYPALRDYLRRLLTAFLQLATTSDHQYGSTFVRERLDSLLHDTQQRSTLRIAMGLEQQGI